MHIWTENPLTEMWHQLRYLESELNVQRLLSGAIRTARTPLLLSPQDVKKRAREIASCIKQADEYFSASAQVDLVTRPLLQFYGIENLAKASVLATDTSHNLINFTYHGLKTKSTSSRIDLESYRKDPSMWEVEREFALISNGLFPNFCKAVENISIQFDTELRFKDLIRVIPDISALYQRHYGEPSYCFYLYDGPKLNPQGYYQVLFDPQVNLDDVIAIFPEFGVGYERFENEPARGFRSLQPSHQMPAWSTTEKGTVAGQYLVRPHTCGMHTATTLIFAAMFILSNTVRYKPDFWMDVVEGRNSGVISVVDALCNLTQRRFPNDVLQTIWQEDFTYGSPARFS